MQPAYLIYLNHISARKRNMCLAKVDNMLIHIQMKGNGQGQRGSNGIICVLLVDLSK